MSVNKSRYQKVVNLIIDKIEGGYYHPDMLKDGRVKDSRYANSGETMFGIDRKSGGSLNTSEAGKKFWSVIDNAGARKSWKWNYKGGSLEPSLKNYAGDIMYNQYDKLANDYLTPEAKKIVDSDDRLLFNFIYATWNGSGWFKKFAEKFNELVSKGITNTDDLVRRAISERVNSSNSLISQGGNKIKSFIYDLKNRTETSISQVADKFNWMPLAIFSFVILGTVCFSLAYKTKKS